MIQHQTSWENIVLKRQFRTNTSSWECSLLEKMMIVISMTDSRIVSLIDTHTLSLDFGYQSVCVWLKWHRKTMPVSDRATLTQLFLFQRQDISAGVSLTQLVMMRLLLKWEKGNHLSHCLPLSTSMMMTSAKVSRFADNDTIQRDNRAGQLKDTESSEIAIEFLLISIWSQSLDINLSRVQSELKVFSPTNRLPCRAGFICVVDMARHARQGWRHGSLLWLISQRGYTVDIDFSRIRELRSWIVKKILFSVVKVCDTEVSAGAFSSRVHPAEDWGYKSFLIPLFLRISYPVSLSQDKRHGNKWDSKWKESLKRDIPLRLPFAETLFSRRIYSVSRL